MDVLRAMGTLGPLERRGPMGRARQLAGANSRASLPSCGGVMGERKRWSAARSRVKRLPPNSERRTLAKRHGGYRLSRQSHLERYSHGGSVRVAATVLLVQREVWTGKRFVCRRGRQRN